jgi:hypothetical protein
VQVVQMTQEMGTIPRVEAPSTLRFGPFCLENDKHVWCGDQQVDLRPHSLAILRYLGLSCQRGKKQRSELSTLVGGVLFCTFARHRLASPGGP